MKEDLNFQGTQLNQINTIFYGGYLLGQIPNNLIMQKISPRIWLPLTCFAWGMLTLGTAFVHHPWQIMVIRFFQGVFEASCFVGVQWILGSWYKPAEIGKRTAIFTSSGLAGTMFSGILQGAIYRNLDGKSGFAGWRWLFVVDALITLPIALYGWLLFPDTPASTKAKYLNTEERIMAIERLPEIEKARGVLGWSLIKRVLLTWQWWGFVTLWIANSNTEMFSTNGIYQIWLGTTGNYSVEQVNYIPTSQSGFGIVCTLLLGWYSDINTRNRWHVGVILTITAIISGALMLNPPNDSAKFAALILNGAQFAGQTVMFAWANDLTRHDDAKRSVVIASMNMLSVAVYMWWSIVFYNASQAPDWYEGSIAMICMGVFLGFVTAGCLYGQKRQEKQEALTRGDSFGDSETAPEKLDFEGDTKV